jgi:hypothetical protein
MLFDFQNSSPPWEEDSGYAPIAAFNPDKTAQHSKTETENPDCTPP